MAENALAIAVFLSGPESTLSSPGLKPSPYAPKRAVHTVYFNLFGQMVVYTFLTAKVLYGVIFAMTLSSVLLRGVGGGLGKGFKSVIAAMICAQVVPHLQALLMTRVLGRPMSWFSHPWLGLALYGPSVLAGKVYSRSNFSADSPV